MIFTIYTSNFHKYDAAGQLIQHITQDSVLLKFVWGIHNRKLMGSNILVTELPFVVWTLDC